MMINSFFGNILPEFNVNNKIGARALNNMQYGEIFNRLTNIALSRFVWNGLPDSCRPEILEQTLLFYGKALFVDDPYLGFIHTPVNLHGPYNVYYESIIRHAFSFEYHRDFTIDDSVLIKANHTMFPDYITIWNYTPKIANAIRAIDVHLETLKRPFLISCPDKTVQSVRHMINKISDNEIGVVGEKFGEDGEIKILPLSSNSNLQDMWACAKNYFNQVLNSLGVKNSFTEKRERMITTEANGEGNTIRHTLESELSERKIAAERINNMYGLNVSVEANEIEVFMDELMEFEAARITGNMGGTEDVSNVDTN